MSVRSVLAFRRFRCVFLFLFFAGFVAAADMPAEVQPNVRRTVRVGYGALPGYHELGADGQRSGYGYEYLQRIASYTGWSYEYIGYDKGWPELRAMLERGEIDLLSCVKKTPENESKFAFSDSSVGISFLNVTVKEENTRFSQANYSTWNGMRIGMLKNYPINDEFTRWAEEKNIQYTPIFFDTYQASHEALMAGTVDAMLSINFRRMENEWLEILFSMDPHVDSQHEMLKIIADYMEASRCEIIHINFSDQTAETIAEYYSPEAGPLMMNRTDLRFEVEWEIITKLLNGETVLLDNLDDEHQLDVFPLMRVLRRERDLKSIFIAGIYIKEKLWGEIEIVYEGTKANPFSLNQLTFLRSAAHIVELLLIRERSNQQLKDALKDAQSASRAKSFFFATMSHEIRTPLNAVIGFAELLKDRSLSIQEQQEYLADITTSGNSLLALINDILDLSKLESGQMKFISEETDFPALVREMKSIFKARLVEKKLSCVTHIKSMPILKTDKLRLRQILFNLVGNAVKFVEQGTVTISGEFLTEGISNKGEHKEGVGTLRFSVEDTGCGIEEKDHEKIFQPFVQAEAIVGTRVSNNGTGLGLAIVRRMLEQMNGKIFLKSTPGKGSIFTVEIYDIAFSLDAPISSQEISDAGDTIDPSLRVLVVDDVDMNIKVLLAMCRMIGLTHIETVRDGKSALAKLKEHPFNVILTDLCMPGMSGSELATIIRENKQFDSIRIIGITAEADNISELDLRNFDDVMQKPITLEKIKKAIL